MDIQEFIYIYIYIYEKFTKLEALIINFHGKSILYERESYTLQEKE
jgi:hypothetical protein